ncbi:YafY family protein [Compostibacter hankyongensis]|uniref:YafY family protein n=1 Tax=Compostibacter hankyongensis TaxID=1007089 RepID=A0ABP8FK13_9BACT
MNRLDRLTTILTTLQSGRWHTAEAFAERFGISIRTVYRDIRSLEAAGVPVLSEAGRGYSLMEGYRLPPVMFTRSEAAALLAGEKLLVKQNSDLLQREYGLAMEKVRAVLRGPDRDFMETLRKKMQVYHIPGQKPSVGHGTVFSFLQECLYRSQVVNMEYAGVKGDAPLRRTVEPLGFVQQGNHWYLAGWCRLRQDYRTFRLDRIRQYEGTAEMLPPTHPHTLEGFFSHYRNMEQKYQVTVRFASDCSRYVGDQKYLWGWCGEQQDAAGITMQFLTGSLKGIAHWLLTWGNGVTVLGPEALQEKMRDLAREIHAHYMAGSR